MNLKKKKENALFMCWINLNHEPTHLGTVSGRFILLWTVTRNRCKQTGSYGYFNDSNPCLPGALWRFLECINKGMRSSKPKNKTPETSSARVNAPQNPRIYDVTLSILPIRGQLQGGGYGAPSWTPGGYGKFCLCSPQRGLRCRG